MTQPRTELMFTMGVGQTDASTAAASRLKPALVSSSQSRQRWPPSRRSHSENTKAWSCLERRSSFDCDVMDGGEDRRAGYRGDERARAELATANSDKCQAQNLRTRGRMVTALDCEQKTAGPARRLNTRGGRAGE